MSSEIDYAKIEAIAIRVANETSTTQMAAMAKEATREGIIEAFIVLGIDAEQPFEMQKDFLHLRTIRERGEDIVAKVTDVGIKASFVAFLAYLGLDKFTG